MSKFKNIVESPAGSKHVLQGNSAFALGIAHAGYHAADGYPGTPSTEVIDKGLAHIQDRITVGWSVNEAVAMGVAVGHSVAGRDVVVTMKIPGVFQAGDVISTSSFYTADAGALVIYVATDYVPSSTQHVIDVRHFFASCRVPVLEPRSHQEMYDITFIASDISRRFHTPVVVLASGILAHSEGLVTTRESRAIESRPLPETLQDWMLTPAIARANYNAATTQRIPGIRRWAEESDLVTLTGGNDDFGIIVNGEAEIVVREALHSVGADPSILSLAITNPVPLERVKSFAKEIKGPLVIIEDGDRFLEERLRLAGIELTGKDIDSVTTDWTPPAVLEFLAGHGLVTPPVGENRKAPEVAPVPRPPSICPGCPYRAFGLAVAKLKKKKKIYATFGDIGCSTLLYFMNALDTVLCMGASDSMRQGFSLSRPDMAHKVISVLGDSCECHSGLDATRNAVFRNTPGVKVVLDNRITAMTGGQPAPSSETNLQGDPNKFNLREAIAAEKCRTVTADAYDNKEVARVLAEALELAETGEFTTLILEGACIHEVPPQQRIRQLEIDREKCKQCGLCDICPGIQLDKEKNPQYTMLCSNCGTGSQVCRQQCHFGAIVEKTGDKSVRAELPEIHDPGFQNNVQVEKDQLPQSLRVAIRGIGGQGNLFFGKVLAEVALRTPYSSANIVKGDTHGMAQLGGPVISTFSCGVAHSPVLAPGSTDVLVVMEANEVLRPGFLELMKPGGTILFNDFEALPATARKGDYPSRSSIDAVLEDYTVITADAYKVAQELGDKSGRSANVVMLGLLSSIAPFTAVPREIWLDAIMAVSPNDYIKNLNRHAFEAGRKIS